MHPQIQKIRKTRNKNFQRHLDLNSIEYHLVKSECPTVIKLRVFSRDQQMMRLDFEKYFMPDDEIKLYAKVSQLIGSYNVLVLSDFGKGSIQNPQKFIAIFSTSIAQINTKLGSLCQWAPTMPLKRSN